MVVGESRIGVGLFFPRQPDGAGLSEELMQDVERYELCKFELKYCELCGALWIRTKGTTTPHCAACKQHIAQLAPPRSLETCRTRRQP
jgi:hypothetical protein